MRHLTLQPTEKKHQTPTFGVNVASEQEMAAVYIPPREFFADTAIVQGLIHTHRLDLDSGQSIFTKFMIIQIDDIALSGNG